MINRRQTLGALGAGLLALQAPAIVRAQPAVTRLLVGATPGGGTDIVARALAQELSTRTGRQYVVDNKPGAAGNIAAQMVAQAAPDGATLLLSYTSHAINPTLYTKLPFDTQKDFTPIAGVATIPALLVANPALPARDVRELIALAKARPGQLNIAIAGLGSANHLAGEVLKLQAGVDIISVPYKGTGPALQDVIAGQIQLAISGVASVQQLVKGGKVKAIGVTSARRVAEFPDVQAIGEVLPGFDFSSWYGLFGPAGMDARQADTLSAAVRDVLGSPALLARLKHEGILPMPSRDRAEFERFVNSEISRWGKVVQQTGATPQ
ncbi:tripartite tricarboxylate transporter substrate binding protein [Xenophilus arseniciresistens]|uniref:Tripartite tricarboxylate transporter substrate binding protein n=1 Tax=Xenophilus arseniciresistens TaxID=1283306 RepID=A0AAE3N847_9BURK|nr:tripartite tricarboxylate transporter substrate binding protein [Xenophilus arseniciresistens]MDA7417355.1 tripartite tricarboxylate transporter substrate binding protein [Xenophilus arseniciresistens]